MNFVPVAKLPKPVKPLRTAIDKLNIPTELKLIDGIIYLVRTDI